MNRPKDGTSAMYSSKISTNSKVLVLSAVCLALLVFEAVAADLHFYRAIGFACAIAGCSVVIVVAIWLRRDILRHEKSENALHAAERNLRNIFENAPVGIFKSCDDGRWLSANQTMASMLGFETPEELLYHRNVLQTPLYVDPEARPALVQRLKSNGIVQDCETNWFAQYCGTVWVRGSGRVIEERDGGCNYEAMLYDVTARKLTEEQLANVKSQLENFFNSATGVSIISTDVQGRITIFTPGA